MSGSVTGFGGETIHRAETAGDKFIGVAPLFPDSGSIDRGSPADAASKQAAKGADTFKTDGKTNIGDRQGAIGQEMSGLLQSFSG